MQGGKDRYYAYGTIVSYIFTESQKKKLHLVLSTNTLLTESDYSPLGYQVHMTIGYHSCLRTKCGDVQISNFTYTPQGALCEPQ